MALTSATFRSTCPQFFPQRAHRNHQRTHSSPSHHQSEPNASPQCRETRQSGSEKEIGGVSGNPTHVTKRGLLCSVGLAILPVYSSDAEDAVPKPQFGDCPTCLGPSSGSLGSCSGVEACFSTYDDRPKYFIAPWETETTVSKAKEKIKGAIQKIGGEVEEEDTEYLYVVFGSGGETDDVEFLFPPNDATVAIRSAARTDSPSAYKRNQQRLERLRRLLGWVEVPIIRNRKRRFFFLESPLDDFGPEPGCSTYEGCLEKGFSI